MSPTSTSEVTNAPFTTNDTAEKASIDAALDKLLKHFPQSPYILTVPSYDLELNPWILQNEADLFRRTYPFRTAENHKQYMSFFLRDPADSCFDVRTELDEERDKRAKDKPVSSPLPSTGPKKKISLAAYKSKFAGGDKSQQQSPQPVKQDKSAQDSKLDSQLKVINNIKKEPHKTLSMSHSSTSQKRKSPEPNGSLGSDIANKRSKPNSTSRQGLPPLLSPLPKKHAADLPPLLSPLGDKSKLPPMLSPLHSVSLDLPPLLSPTLSPTLEEQLRRLENERSKSDLGSTPPSSKKSLSQDSPASVSKPKPIPASTSSNPKPDPEPRKQRLIVRLKYSKRLRKDIIRILAPSGSKKPPSVTSETSKAKFTDQVSSTKLKSTTTSSTKTKKMETSRHRTSELGSPTALKRPRASRSPSPPPPSTPKDPPLSSSKPKVPVTPNQPSSSSAMARSGSNTSFNATPRHSTPLPPAKAKDAQELSVWSKRFNDLGRSLKHEAQAIQSSFSSSRPITNPSSATDADKLKAVRNIDCVLSYMLAYSHNDARLRLINRPLDFEGSWATLSGMIEVARTSARFSKDLEGLCCALGIVVDQKVVAGISSAITAELTKGDEDMDVKKLAGLNTRQIKLNEKMTAKLVSVNTYMPLWKIRKVFHGTFEKITTDPPNFEDNSPTKNAGEDDLLATHGLVGDVTFPFTQITTPPEAVRFGIVLVQEWIGLQELDIDLKVAAVKD
jgi:hypothetical protein